MSTRLEKFKKEEEDDDDEDDDDDNEDDDDDDDDNEDDDDDNEDDDDDNDDDDDDDYDDDHNDDECNAHCFSFQECIYVMKRRVKREHVNVVNYLFLKNEETKKKTTTTKRYLSNHPPFRPFIGPSILPLMNLSIHSFPL